MLLQSIPENCNYIEVVLVNAKYENKIVVDQTYNDFERLLSKIKNIKYFQKEYKCYQYQNLIYENYYNKDTKVYTKDCISIDDDIHNSFVLCFYSKEKKPFHLFPSTTDIHSIYQVKKLIFRLHNRLYLNFESQYYHKTNCIVRKVYFNYNHEKNVELSCINQQLQQYVQILNN